MKKLITMVVILLIGLMPLVQASLVEDFGIDETKLDGLDLPNVVRAIFGNQNINIYINLNSGRKEVYGLATENGVITKFLKSELEKSTLNVYSTEDVIGSIASSNDPLKEMSEALKDGRITYKAVGVKNKIRFGFVSLFAKFAGLFGEKRSSVTGGSVVNIKKEPKMEVVEEFVPEVEDEVIVSAKHIIKMTRSGFEPEILEISVGDTVVWEMDREAPYDQGMVIGVRKCRDVKSELLRDGDTHDWTFNDLGVCTIVDGIMTTKVSKITVK